MKNSIYVAIALLLSACVSAPQTSIAPENTNDNRSEANVHIENLLPTPLVSQPVAQPNVTEIRTVQQELTLAEGEQKLLVAEVVLSDGTQNNRDITWASSNTRIVSISTTGLAERLGTGEVTITAISRQDPGFRLDIKVLDAPSTETSATPTAPPAEAMPELLPTPAPRPEPSPSEPMPDVPAPSASPSASESSSNPETSTNPSATVPQSTPTPTPTPTPQPIENYTISALGMHFVGIPAGSFMMGREGVPNSIPVHSVTLSAFQIQTTEVTQKQWWDVMGSWPGSAPDNMYGMGDNYPMYNVSWADAQLFIQRLNQNYSGTYRLPTEAEWEYAARAGTTGDYACGNQYIAGANGCPGSMAWFNDNNGYPNSPDFGSKPVGTKQANAWGLYDMHGNLWEWVQDHYGNYTSSPKNNPTGPETGATRVLRGGFFDANEFGVLSAIRNQDAPSTRYTSYGFRVVRQP